MNSAAKIFIKAFLVAALAVMLLSLLRGAEFLLIIVAAALIHEAGHALTAKVLGVPACGRSSLLFGFSLKYDFSAVSYGKEIAVSAAGAAINSLASVLAYLIFGADGTYSLFFIFSNISLAVFNLLPVSPLDGSGVLRALLSLFTDPGRADRAAKLVSAVFAFSFFVFCVYVQLKVGVNMSLMFISVVLLLNAAKEFKALKIKEP